jgi:glutaredoxin 3
MKAELYTTSSCPFCKLTLDLLDARGIEYVNHVMDGSLEELMEVKRRFGHRTVPIVLLDGEFIGGNDDLQALDRAGRLAAS